ncbi:MAG: tetratricopeptide repeat protein, partial [Planctomycetes bacterium]|nr:tetratricopeptide repeat protein [Planctomycetota bacterium]
HRDLKPSNILVDARGAPHVLDVGLAKLVSRGTPEGPPLTLTQDFVGTPAYAAPEQLRGEPAAIDVRADVYALGVILYEMLTGRLPYPADAGLAGLLEAMARADAAAPSSMERSLGRELDALALTAIAKEPARRYQSVDALGADVRRYLNGEPLDARRDSGWYVLRKNLRRHRVPVALVFAFVVVVAMSAVALSVMYARQGRLLAQTTVARDAETAARLRAQRMQSFVQGLLLNVSDIGRGADLGVRRAMLEEAARRAETELADDPLARAAAHDAIGRTFQSLGLYDDAEAHLRTALAMRQRLFGSEHAEAAASLNALGELLTDRDRFREAGPLFDAALAMRQRLFGEVHLSIAESLNNVGLALQSRGEYDAAEHLHQRAADIYRQLHGGDHPDVAECLGQLANTHLNRGHYAAAEPLFRSALEIHRRFRGEEHRDVAGAKVSLAKALHHRAAYPEAEPLFREAIATFRRQLGTEHDTVAWGLHRLGVLLHARGSYGEAEGCLRESLAIYRRCLGEDDPYVGFVLDSLGNLLLDRGAYDEAEAVFTAALERHERLSASPEASAWASNRLGELRQVQGRYEEAEPLLRAALDNAGARAGVEHPHYVRTLSSLAALLLATGRAPEAVVRYQEALDWLRGHVHENHPDVAETSMNLAVARCRAGDCGGTESTIRTVLERQCEVLGDDHPRVAGTLHVLARTLLERRDPDRAADAAAAANRALAICRAKLTNRHVLLADTLELLAGLHAAQGVRADAEACADEARAIRERNAARVAVVSP